MPEQAWRYAIPRDIVDKYHVRKYGAHGTSHRYIWRTVNEFMGGKTHKLVSCHLGSGASLRIEDGQCKDTTMGLTPLDGSSWARAAVPWTRRRCSTSTARPT